MALRQRLLVMAVVGLIGVTLAALWTLRQPIQTGVKLLTRGTSRSVQLRFAVVGDNHGVNPVYRQIIDELKDKDLSFLLNVADTTEFGTREEFLAIQELEQSLPFPVYHTLGNHDIKSDSTRKIFTEVFDQEPWRSYTFGQVHLVILDNGDRKAGFSEASLDWLEKDLSEHKDKSILVAYHRPFDLPLSAIVGDDETSTSRASNRRLVSILRQYPVKQIFTGHIHTYLPYAVSGIPAVVTGGGGDPAQSILGGPANNNFHYLVVEIADGIPRINVHHVQLR